MVNQDYSNRQMNCRDTVGLYEEWTLKICGYVKIVYHNFSLIFVVLSSFLAVIVTLYLAKKFPKSGNTTLLQLWGKLKQSYDQILRKPTI